ncbi:MULTISPECIES: DUF6684 family protein [unclassified Haladaptatus]|uniref:DUF6684 family protein n=1 Tax=unclassified Haladaptatus TaxID=2622732 RepID=UPI0007B4A4AF|nr:MULTISPECIES: DUF6684 family protein [unclassified Haladaptatus]KZN24223.1 cox cluster protein [Haladaptatus sp. R4]MCO8246157.1 cox cluster protein [Haladaptatus sp. AB643]MCO8254223.1 cox cluster protein [Haladaptatus sp. AB618]
MAQSVFSKETLLNLMVNIIPLGIIVCFFVAFVGFNAWSNSGLGGMISIALLVLPFIALAALTYIAAQKIEVATGT